jgi:hypothetical protein
MRSIKISDYSYGVLKESAVRDGLPVTKILDRFLKVFKEVEENELESQSISPAKKERLKQKLV